MRLRWICAALLFGTLVGCAGQSSVKPVEVLDERTGMTLAALQQPIEFVQSAEYSPLAFGKRTSFAYLGPVEWNRMGDISYGLWIHIAPGNDRQVGDILVPGATTLILDDGPMILTPIEPPALGRDAYQPVVSWGQTAYFALNAETLKHMAASEKLQLDFHSADGSTVSFTPSHGTRAPLAEYAKGRGISVD